MEEVELKDKTSSDVKCSSCGSAMEFNPASQQLECAHCGNAVAFDNNEIVVKKPFESLEDNFTSWNKESVLVQCLNCGAKEVVSARNITHKCSFCGSSKLNKSEDTPGLKPNGVLPFTVTEKQATFNFMKWLKRKWFTPSDLKKSARIHTFGGVYSPTWSYDTQVHTVYDGVLTRTETYRQGDRTVTHTVSFPVRGKRDDTFLDLLIPVGQKIDRVSFKKLEPFKFGNLKVYDSNYLAGFSANHYNINAQDAWKSAMQTMESKIRSRIVASHGADGVQYLNLHTNYQNTKYAYLLLPIWVCNYNYKQKLFNFFINGNTGKVTGKVPRSAFKIILFSLFIASLFWLFIYFGNQAGLFD